MSMLDFTLGSQVYLACGVTDLMNHVLVALARSIKNVADNN